MSSQLLAVSVVNNRTVGLCCAVHEGELSAYLHRYVGATHMMKIFVIRTISLLLYTKHLP